MGLSDPGGLVEACDAIESAASRVVALIRSASNLGDAVPGLEWTVGETAAHLVGACRLYAEAIAGGAQKWVAPYLSGAQTARARVAEGNAGTLAEMAHDNAVSLAAQLDEAVGSFLKALAGHSSHATVNTPWWGEGQSRDLATLASIALGEFLVHGYDIARALRRRWSIDRAHASLVIDGAMSMIPDYVNPATASHLDATYMIHVRGGSRFVIHFRKGGATVNSSSQQVDCHLSVDPVAFLLVGYGRISQWGPIAKGQLIAWGRKPWLGLKFKSLLLNP